MNKELLINRIIAGCFKCGDFIIKYPTRFERYLIEEKYSEIEQASLDAGSYTNKELLYFLLDRGLWSEEEQKMLDTLAKDIEEFKVGLFDNKFQSRKRDVTRKALGIARDKQLELFNKLHEYDYLSAKGVATMAKARLTIAFSLHNERHRKLFNVGNIDYVEDRLVQKVASILGKMKIEEEDMRLIARNEPWRSIWLTRKSEGSVFGVPAADLNDEQRVLSVWSTVYDNIHEHPECPADDIIDDDDMLDGWMIVQKRKRDSDRDNNATEQLIGNEKIRNSDEVFIMADSAEEARRIHNMNDPGTRALKRQREAFVRQKGMVSETNMPDSQLKLRQMATTAFIEKVKG